MKFFICCFFPEDWCVYLMPFWCLNMIHAYEVQNILPRVLKKVIKSKIAAMILSILRKILLGINMLDRWAPIDII